MADDEPMCRYCGDPLPPLTPEQEKSQERQLTPRVYCDRSCRKAHSRRRAHERQAARLLAVGRLLDPVEGCPTPDKKGIWVDPFAAQRLADTNGQYVYRCKAGDRLHYHLTTGSWGTYRRYDKPGDDIDDKLRWAQSRQSKAEV